EHLQPRAVRPEADDAAALQADVVALPAAALAALGDVDAALVLLLARHLRDALVADADVQPAVHAHADAAGDVVVEARHPRDRRAEVGEQVLAVLRLALAVEGEDGDVRGVNDVELVADEFHAHDGPQLVS